MIPPRRLLAAVDFSPGSAAALRCAGQMARRYGADLHVLYAEDPLLAAVAREAAVDLAADTRSELDRFAKDALGEGPRPTLSHVQVGPAAQTILKVAEQEAADLIVVGASGMSGPQKLLFGSTTDPLLRSSATPLLVVPPEWAPSPAGDLTGVGPVIAGVDFEPASIAAARVAVHLAATLGTTPILVHVCVPIRVPVRWRAHAEKAISGRVDRAASELSRVARTMNGGDPLRTSIREGRVPEELAATASAYPRALIVLGRSLPGDGHPAPGTIAARIIALAGVPVLIYVS